MNRKAQFSLLYEVVGLLVFGLVSLIWFGGLETILGGLTDDNAVASFNSITSAVRDQCTGLGSQGGSLVSGLDLSSFTSTFIITQLSIPETYRNDAQTMGFIQPSMRKCIGANCLCLLELYENEGNWQMCTTSDFDSANLLLGAYLGPPGCPFWYYAPPSMIEQSVQALIDMLSLDIFSIGFAAFNPQDVDEVYSYPAPETWGGCSGAGKDNLMISNFERTNIDLNCYNLTFHLDYYMSDYFPKENINSYYFEQLMPFPKLSDSVKDIILSAIGGLKTKMNDYILDQIIDNIRHTTLARDFDEVVYNFINDELSDGGGIRSTLEGDDYGYDPKIIDALKDSLSQVFYDENYAGDYGVGTVASQMLTNGLTSSGYNTLEDYLEEVSKKLSKDVNYDPIITNAKNTFTDYYYGVNGIFNTILNEDVFIDTEEDCFSGYSDCTDSSGNPCTFEDGSDCKRNTCDLNLDPDNFLSDSLNEVTDNLRTMITDTFNGQVDGSGVVNNLNLELTNMKKGKVKLEDIEYNASVFSSELANNLALSQSDYLTDYFDSDELQKFIDDYSYVLTTRINEMHNDDVLKGAFQNAVEYIEGNLDYSMTISFTDIYDDFGMDKLITDELIANLYTPISEGLMKIIGQISTVINNRALNSYRNEDLNGNGVLDKGEDYNGNGVLDTGSPDIGCWPAIYTESAGGSYFTASRFVNDVLAWRRYTSVARIQPALAMFAVDKIGQVVMQGVSAFHRRRIQKKAEAVVPEVGKSKNAEKGGDELNTDLASSSGTQRAVSVDEADDLIKRRQAIKTETDELDDWLDEVDEFGVSNRQYVERNSYLGDQESISPVYNTYRQKVNSINAKVEAFNGDKIKLLENLADKTGQKVYFPGFIDMGDLTGVGSLPFSFNQFTDYSITTGDFSIANLIKGSVKEAVKEAAKGVASKFTKEALKQFLKNIIKKIPYWTLQAGILIGINLWERTIMNKFNRDVVQYYHGGIRTFDPGVVDVRSCIRMDELGCDKDMAVWVNESFYCQTDLFTRKVVNPNTWMMALKGKDKCNFAGGNKFMGTWSCINNVVCKEVTEDVNYNGVLDEGEDKDGDGAIDILYLDCGSNIKCTPDGANWVCAKGDKTLNCEPPKDYDYGTKFFGDYDKSLTFSFVCHGDFGVFGAFKKGFSCSKDKGKTLFKDTFTTCYRMSCAVTYDGTIGREADRYHVFQYWIGANGDPANIFGPSYGNIELLKVFNASVARGVDSSKDWSDEIMLEVVGGNEEAGIPPSII